MARTSRNPSPAPSAGMTLPRAAPNLQQPKPSDEQDLGQGSYAVKAIGEAIDRSLHATTARLTGGLSPAAMWSAYTDWAVHLAMSPGKQTELYDKAFRKNLRFAKYLGQLGMQSGKAEACIDPLPQDKRFADPAWREWPFNAISQSFLLVQQWWHNATTGVGGVSKRHEAMVGFGARQILDMCAPSNFLPTNPEVLSCTQEQAGLNLLRGYQNFLEDFERATNGRRPVGAETFAPGRNVAVTPGKVVYRNRLIELIQYAPATDAVRPEPVLIIPAWIMKYYILDLSPENSLVRYLTAEGFTVFMISWKNPGPEDRDLTFDAYRTLGVMAALGAISATLPRRKVHAVGYCLGGTLLSIAAAAMARDHDDRLQSVSLFASQTDFTEAGELQLFIDESQLDFLDDLMWEQGFLDTKQMAGAFQLLRSKDLVWSRAVKNYLMGAREPMNDLMAWNADATRMPYKMHAQYLKELFLDNALAEGRFAVDGRPIALNDIRAPIFAVGAEQDHVAPWRSTFKVHLQTESEVTYLLTTGGHNAGIVSQIGHKGRSYRVRRRGHNQGYLDPDTWLEAAARKQGSWWPEWTAWLAAHSGPTTTPPRIRDALADAPGSYVLKA
jgi:polyhydroxyalkanoate synthase subunit PhaC